MSKRLFEVINEFMSGEEPRDDDNSLVRQARLNQYMSEKGLVLLLLAEIDCALEGGPDCF
jgi:hypothetical protein